MTKKHYILILLIFGVTTVLLGSGCKNTKTDSATKGDSTTSQQSQYPPDSYKGEAGTSVSIQNAQIALDSKLFDDGLAHFYNTVVSTGQTVYFFVVKDSSGVYRAAGNACQVCFDTRSGFRQEGNFMVCNTCGNKYPLEKIATEKGGCNPIPINPNLKVKNGQVIVDQIDIEQINEFF